jgi:hypothetical protein
MEMSSKQSLSSIMGRSVRVTAIFKPSTTARASASRGLAQDFRCLHAVTIVLPSSSRRIMPVPPLISFSSHDPSTFSFVQPGGGLDHLFSFEILFGCYVRLTNYNDMQRIFFSEV